MTFKVWRTYEDAVADLGPFGECADALAPFTDPRARRARPMEVRMEELIATLVLAREKAEGLDRPEIADKCSSMVTSLRREQRKAAKEAEKDAAKK